MSVLRRLSVILPLIATLLLVSLGESFAASSSDSDTQAPSSTVMDANKYPRALRWPQERVWQSSDGQILVCPWKNSISGRMACSNEEKSYAWISIHAYPVEGMRLIAYEFRYLGRYGEMVLITYYGK